MIMVFDEFLDWADEQGLPFRSWAEALEEKGLPGWLPIVIVLVLVGAVAFFFLQPPAKGTVVVYAKTVDGLPLSDVNVSIYAGGFQKSLASGESGRVSFEGVPPGEVRLVASAQIVLEEPTSYTFELKPGASEEKTFRSTLTQSQTVLLRVDVIGAPSASLTLLADDKEVDYVRNVPTFSFNVLPSKTYVIKAEAPGYLPAEESVDVRETNANAEVIMQKKGEVTKASLRVRVLKEAVAEEPVENASVRVLESNKIVAQAVSAEDGSITPVSVGLGSQVTVVASKEGFAEKTVDLNISSLEQKVVVLLAQSLAPKEGFSIQVRDPVGNLVRAPIVRLYKGSKLKEEKLPDDGVAFFDMPLSGLSASVYKPGFLPIFLEQLKKENAVVLQLSSENSSAAIKVFVRDFHGRDAPGATIDLLRPDRKPIGIPPRVTGVDGTQRFEDVPLAQVIVRASLEGRVKESERFTPENEENEFNATIVEIQFDPLQIAFKARVLDRFSRQPVSGAKVSVGELACTTSAKGECVIKLLETDAAVAKISAKGYEDFQSSEFAVSPFEVERTFELFSFAVAQALRLAFVGVFDVAGNKVDRLSPLAEYEARYVLRAPNVSFAKAEAFVEVNGAKLLGGQSVGVRVTKGVGESKTEALETIQITPEGFFPASFDAPVGGSVPFANSDNRTHMMAFDDGQALVLKPNEKKNVVFNKAGSFGFRSLADPQFTGFVTVTEKPSALSEEDAKNVLFEFPKFSGSKELAVRFKTSREEVTLKHRTAFFAETEVLRDPPEGLKESGKFPVDFQGECTEQVCVQFYFERNKQKVKKLDLPLNEEALLVVRVAGLEQAGLLRVTPSEAVSIESGRNDLTMASVGNESLLRLPKGSSVNNFTIKGKRLSDDASLKIEVLVRNETIFEADAFLRVFSKTKPALVVKVKPNKVEALASTKVTFSVTDSLYNEPVAEARVSVGGQEAQAEKPGEYAAEVQPESLEPIRFEVVKTGFKTFRGAVSVEPPDELLEVEPKLLTLSVDSKESVSGQVQATNKLADSLSVSLSFSVDGNADLTDLRLSPSSLNIKGKQSSSFALLAAIKEDVLAVAKKMTTLKEDLKGTIRLNARAKSFSSEQQVRFSVQSSFTQQALDDVWQLSADSLSFRLEPPKKKEEKQEVRVSNQGPHPLVFNVEQTLGLSVQPASLILPPGGEGVFAVKAFAKEVDCFSEDLQKQGSLTVHATFQGITSKKTAPVTIDITTANMVCMPSPGSRVTLPVDARLLLLPNSRTKTNPDGSTSVLLPTRELIGFGPGASVTPVEASVPYTTPIIFETYRVRPLADGWAVSFPTPTVLTIPQEADRELLPSGEVQVTLENAQIVLPQGTRIDVPRAGVKVTQTNEALVPASVPVIFRRVPYNYDALRNILPPDAVEVTLPVDAVFELPAGTIERSAPRFSSTLSSRIAQENLQNVKAIQLPSGERVAFSMDAALVLEQKTVRLPAGATLYVSKDRVKKTDDNVFELKMPIAYALLYALDFKVFKTSAGLYALRLTDEASVEASWKLSPTKKATGFELRVPRENALIYRKGASARVPTDPASLAKCRFSYASAEELTFNLPEGASIEKAEGSYLATMRKCDATSKIKFTLSTASGTPEVLETPAIKQLYFPSNAQFLTGDAQSAGEKTIKVKGKAQFVSCLKDEEGKDVSESLQTLRLSFPEDSFIALPPRVAVTKETQEIDFGQQPVAVKIQTKDTPQQELGSTKKISIDRSSFEVNPVGPPDYPAYGLAFQAGSGMHYTPLCDKAPRRLDVKATSEDVDAEWTGDDKKTLKVTFSNKKEFKPSETREACIYNKGKDVIFVDGVRAETEEPTERRWAVEKIMDTSQETAYFKETQFFGNKQRSRLEPQPKAEQPACNGFVFKLNLPKEMMIEERCIRSEWDAKTLKGKYVFQIKDVNNEPLASSPKHELAAEITFDAKAEDCVLFKEQRQVEDLVQLSVNYDKQELAMLQKGLAEFGIEKLVFKNVGHERFFAVINNEESTLKLEKVAGDGAMLMRCKADGVDLAHGREIKPGNILFLACTSTAEGDGVYELEFSGGAFAKKKQVEVKVYNGGQLYAHSPVGKVIPFHLQGTAAPSVTSRTTHAPTSVLSYSSSDLKGGWSGGPSNWGGGGAPSAVRLQGTTTPRATHAPMNTLLFEERRDAEAEVIPRPTPTPTPQEAEEQRRQRLQRLTELEDFRYCKTFFCTHQQAMKAINSFMKSFATLVDSRVSERDGQPTIKSLQAFSEKLEPVGGVRLLKKTMFLQLTNVPYTLEQTIEPFNTARDRWKQEFFKNEYGEIVIAVNKNDPSTTLSSCGFYEIQATLDPHFPNNYQTPAEWKRAMTFQVSIHKLKECPENLANAGLFTATSQENLIAYGGNRISQGNALVRTTRAFKDAFLGLGKAPEAFKTIFSGAQDKSFVQRLLLGLGQMQQGVLGRYAPTASEKDEETVRELYAALYNVDLKKTPAPLCTPVYGSVQNRPCPAVFYDNLGYCTKTGWGVVTTLTTTAGAFAVFHVVAAVIASPGIGPWGWVKALLSDYRFLTAASSCTASYFTAKDKCGFLEGCTYGILAAMIEMLPVPLPGSLTFATHELRMLQSTNMAFWGSLLTSFGIQTGLGIGIVKGAERILGVPQGEIPVVPVTFIVRKFAGPASIESGYFGLREQVQTRIMEPLKRGDVKLRQAFLFEQALYKENVPRGQARRIAQTLVGLADDDLNLNFAGMLLKFIQKGVISKDALGTAASAKGIIDAAFRNADFRRAEVKRLVVDALSQSNKNFAILLAALPDGYLANIAKKVDQLKKFTDSTKLVDFVRRSTNFKLRVDIIAALNDIDPLAFDALTKTGVDFLDANDKRLSLSKRIGNYKTSLVNELRSDLTRFARIKGLDGLDDAARLRQIAEMYDDLKAAGAKGDLVSIKQVVDSKKFAIQQQGAVKMMKILRYARGTIAFLSPFLFNADFRPVQIKTEPGRTGHVIGYHAENGEPSATAICMGQKSEDECKPGSEKLKDTANLCTGAACVQWFKWFDGVFDSYAVVASFNDNAKVDGKFVRSIFVPEAPPVPYQATLDYAPQTVSSLPATREEQYDATQDIIAQVQTVRAQLEIIKAANPGKATQAQELIGRLDQVISLYRANRVSEATALYQQVISAIPQLTAQERAS